MSRFDVPDEVVSIRVRVQPTPHGRDGVLARSAWAGARTGDMLANQVASAWDDLSAVLPERVKVRVDLLNGTGEPVLSRARTMRNPHRRTAVATSTSPTPTRSDDGLAELDADPSSEMTGMMKMLDALGPPFEGAVGIDPRLFLLQSVTTLSVLQQQTRQLGNLAVALARQNHMMGETLRLAGAGKDDVVAEMLDMTLAATAVGSRAEADVAVARLEAEVEAVKAGKEPDKIDQVTTLLKETRATLGSVTFTKAMAKKRKERAAAEKKGEERGGQAQETKASEPPVDKKQAEEERAEEKQAEEDNKLAQALRATLVGELPTQLAAAGLVMSLPKEQLPNLHELARKISELLGEAVTEAAAK